MSSSSSQLTQPSPVLVLFARGVVARLSLWSVLRIAVDQSWGGAESKEKRTWMASVVVDSFDPDQRANEDGEPDDVYVEEQLLQMMNDEFDVVIEDGSAEPVARDIVRLWTSLREDGEKGKAEEIVKDWETQVAKAKGKAVQAVVQENIDEVDGDDDDDWEDDDGSDEGVDVDTSEAPQLIDASRQKEKDEPVVDEDGFTLVQGKGKNRGHR